MDFKVLLVVLSCILFIVFKRNEYRKWKDQSLAMKLVLFHVGFAFIAFLILLVVIIAQN